MSRQRSPRGRGSKCLPPLRLSDTEHEYALKMSQHFGSFAAWMRARLFGGVDSYAGSPAEPEVNVTLDELTHIAQDLGLYDRAPARSGELPDRWPVVITRKK
jgi:hypothetical protein